MKIIDIQVLFQCDLCNYQWRSSRTNLDWMPKMCPACNKKDWNSKKLDDGFTNEFLEQVRRLAQ